MLELLVSNRREKSGSWERLDDMPDQVAYSYAGYSTTKNSIVILGGVRLAGNTPLPLIRFLDLETMQWRVVEKPSAPYMSISGNYAIGIYNGVEKMFFVGGTNSGSRVTSPCAFNFETEEYEPSSFVQATSTVYQNGAAYFSKGDRIQIFSGIAGSTYQKASQRWILSTDSISIQGVPSITGRGYAAATAIGENLYVYGGNPVSIPSSEMFGRFYIDSSGNGVWEAIPSNIERRREGQMVSIGNKLYMVTGRAITDANVPIVDLINHFVVYDLDKPDDGWVSLADFPGQSRSYSNVVAVDGKIYVLGGLSTGINGPSGQYLKDVWVYTP